MTHPTNREFDHINAAEDNHTQLFSEFRPPSPQRGRGVGERGAEFLQSREERERQLVKPKRSGMALTRCLCLLLFVPFLSAQNQKSDKPSESAKPGSAVAGGQRGPVPILGMDQKVFQIKYADVNRLAQVLKIFGEVNQDSNLKVIAVRVPSGVLPTVEDTIRRLDVPAQSQNVELTVFLLLASDQAGSTDTLPSELESVIKQLKATFAFKGFRLVDTLVLRSRDKQRASVKGLARLDTEIPNPSTYSFGYMAASVLTDDKGHTIRLDDLFFSAKIMVKKQQAEGAAVISYDAIDAGFNTNIDVREGQKIVVGKAAVGGTNTALILVITAKVLE